MSCVVVGAGIAGLSAAYFLQKNGMNVTIYSAAEKKAASNIFIGILYRYPGRWGKKSKYADEAYQASRDLIAEVEKRTGRKVVVSKGVIKKFAPRLKKFTDVQMVDGDALIEDSVSIDMRQYLAGLKELIGKECFVQREIASLDEVAGVKIVAAGFGMKNLLPTSGLMYRKGQQFIGKKALEKSSFGSIVGRGHISYLEGDNICLGSTYETEFADDDVDEEYAEREITKKMEPWCGSLQGVKEKKFVSGVRVGQDTTYLPLVKKVDDETYVFTALGSRGLLYHAYYGKILADEVQSNL